MVYGKTQIWYSWTEKPEANQKDWFYPLLIKLNKLIFAKITN